MLELKKEKKQEKLFLISAMAQRKESSKHCFENCGKVHVGTVNLCDGEFLICKEETCKNAKSEESFGTWYLREEPFEIIIRKLKEIN